MMTLAQIFGRNWGILSVIQKYLCLWKSFRNQATKLLLIAFIMLNTLLPKAVHVVLQRTLKWLWPDGYPNIFPVF